MVADGSLCLLFYISLSPFGSFRLNSPVQLVTDLLSDREWSQFLYSPPYQKQTEHTGQPREGLQINTSAELDPAPDVFHGTPEAEAVYEDIDLSHINSDGHQEMNKVCCTASPQTPVESDEDKMSE